MATTVKKQLCECKNCGNEAEMEITCTLPDVDDTTAAGTDAPDSSKTPKQVKGSAVCTNCGNEADMWIDI